ncbi:hypothetical protein [Streptomyces sp. NPDC057403]|uniref:hypothetical protein n=1 Tax=Streptomyces sp. NPDC057403 TaxID=3346119 RepID=UPI0036B22E54
MKQLRERASQLRREALELTMTAREIEKELLSGGDAQETRRAWACRGAARGEGFG